MAPRPRTWLDDRGLVIAGAGAAPRSVPVWAGALHYWRVPPARWTAALEGLRALGLTCVDTPVPWSVHEPAPERWQWSAEHDLRAFVERAGRAGLSVILRPGPHANVELGGHGFPDDVLRDAAVWARTAHGSPAYLPSVPRTLALPSYGASRLHDRVARWYAALAAKLDGLLAPEGPVVALIVEAAPARFRGGAYDLDYHPEVLERWAVAHPRWPEPPRAWHADDQERCLAWLTFKEAETARAERALSDALAAAGLGELATLGHGDLLPHRPKPGPHLVSSHGPLRAPALRRAALDAFSGGGPHLAESGVGEAPHVPPAGGADADLARALTLLAAGARGLCFAMAVERERWAGALLDRHGAPTPGAGWAAKLLRALHELDWPALRRRADVALVAAESEARVATASCLLDPLTPWLSSALGLTAAGLDELGEESAAVAKRWHAALASALDRAGVAYAVVGEHAAAAELARFSAVLAPVARHLRPELWHTLGELVAEHPVTVVTSPWPAERDDAGRPWSPPPLARRDRPRTGRSGKLRPGSLDDLEGLVSDVAGLGRPAPWRCAPHGFVAELFYDEHRARVAFVVNERPAAGVAELRRADGGEPSGRDAITGEVLAAAAGALRIPLPAEGVRMIVLD